MKLCRVAHRGAAYLARVQPDGLAVLGSDRPDPWSAADDDPLFVISDAEATLLAPLSPRRVLATGANYRSHVEEMGVPAPAVPSGFVKLPPSMCGPGDILLPSDSDAIDYEGEIAIVIGVPAHRIDEHSALGHVAGYLLANDVSARDMPMSQTMLAKGSPCFCPLGPWLVTADEISGPIEFTVSVNGEPRQHGNTGEMIHGFAAIIAAFARAIPLQPGDVILTGTPSGVGAGLSPPRFLTEGDVVTIDSPQLGSLRNRFVAEPQSRK